MTKLTTVLMLAYLFMAPIMPGEGSTTYAVKSNALAAEPVKGKRVADYAKQFLGTRYYYGGRSVKTGFDCSGFTWFVYRHFGIEISPASSQQVYAGKKIPLKDALPGDLLIFTGTRVHIRKPGHVGIVISNTGENIKFIHASSGPAHAVTISQLNGTRYAGRLLEVRRVL